MHKVHANGFAAQSPEGHGPEIFDAFMKACSFVSDTQSLSPKIVNPIVAQALSWASQPHLLILPGMVHRPGMPTDLNCGLNVDQLGGFTINQVWIASRVTDPYEFCLAQVDKITNAKYLEATLLHEMVHWVRAQAGLFADIIAAGVPTLEAGQVFELWAYGRVYCVASDLAEAQSSIF